jgi:hypothetical protein
VIAQVVERASGRAVCLALAAALERFGAPEELLTDNGKQFTARFAATGGEAPFDKICRKNGITHRLTQPRSPTTTGKIERFHQTLRRELLDDAAPFVSVLAAQAALDDWVRAFNAKRPHQSVDPVAPVTRPSASSPPRPSSASCCRCGCPARSSPSVRPSRSRQRRPGVRVRPRPAGRVRARDPGLRQPLGDRPPVLAWARPRRADRPVLGPAST